MENTNTYIQLYNIYRHRVQWRH